MSVVAGVGFYQAARAGESVVGDAVAVALGVLVAPAAALLVGAATLDAAAPAVAVGSAPALASLLVGFPSPTTLRVIELAAENRVIVLGPESRVITLEA